MRVKLAWVLQLLSERGRTRAQRWAFGSKRKDALAIESLDEEGRVAVVAPIQRICPGAAKAAQSLQQDGLCKVEVRADGKIQVSVD